MKRYLPALLALGWLTGAWGGVLSDPTAPPPAWLAEHPPAQGVAGQEAPTGVQMMLIGKTRKFALINGQVVKPGDMYNGSKVLAIKPGKVVVQGESEPLALIPTVEKKVIRPAKQKKTTKASSNKELVNGGVR